MPISGPSYHPEVARRSGQCWVPMLATLACDRGPTVGQVRLPYMGCANRPFWPLVSKYTIFVPTSVLYQRSLFYTLYDFVIHSCEFCFDCLFDLVCGCLCGANEAHSVRDFWVCSYFGFDCIFWIWFVAFAERAKRAEPTRKLLGLFVFFGFGLLFLRSEQSLLGNFWVCSNFGFVHIFLDLICCCFMTFIQTKNNVYYLSKSVVV